MRRCYLLLATASLVTALHASAAEAGDQRFGATAGLSTFGALGWTGGVSASGWLGVAGPLSVDWDLGRYGTSTDEGRWTDRQTLLSGGIGVRRRSGSVRAFAHVLAGVYRETSESDYSDQGGGRQTYTDSQPMWLIGCGVDIPVGKAVAVRLSVENLRVSPDGSALRLNVGVGH